MRTSPVIAAAPLLLLAVGCTQPAPPPAAPARAHALLGPLALDFVAHGDPARVGLPPQRHDRVGVLAQLEPGAPLPRVAGLVVGSRLGDIISARGTRDGIARLADAPGVLRVELARPLRRRRAIAAARTLARRGSLIRARQRLVYKLAAPAAGAVRVRLFPTDDGTGDADVPLRLRLCADAACRTVRGDDLVTLGRTVAGAPRDPRATPVSHAALDHTFARAGDLYIEVTAAGPTLTGAFQLLVSSDVVDLQPAHLTGGDLGAAARPLVVGTGAAVARARDKVDGTGVLIGVVDSGIDWCHRDFQRAGKTRVVSIWDQSLRPRAGERSPDVGGDGRPGNDYGVAYDRAAIDAALARCDTTRVRSVDTAGHGTHVTGIAAGAGATRGMAPGAELVIVKTDDSAGPDLVGDTTQLVDALAHIVAAARRLKRPVVINLSLGGHGGPMDGTSLVDMAITRVIGPGRVVTVSAGNEGQFAVHAGGTAAVGRVESLRVMFPAGTGTGAFRLYSHLADRYDLELQAPSGARLKVAWGRRAATGSRLDGAGITLDVGTARLPRAMASRIRIDFAIVPSTASRWRLNITRTGGTGTGRFDAYLEQDDGTHAFESHITRAGGGVVGTVGSLATSEGALTVGATRVRHLIDSTARGGFAFINTGLPLVAGTLARFSSRGPTRDGRTKPDVVVPGEYLVSTFSRVCTLRTECQADQRSPDRTLYADAGTSMAAPAVAGIVALLLQQERLAYPRPLLRATAAKPGCCPGFRADDWGAGLADVPAALTRLKAARAPAVTLSAAAGRTRGKAPFTVALSATVTNGVKVSEWLWDTTGDGATDAVSTAGTRRAVLTRPGKYTLAVVAVGEGGKTARATLAVEATTKAVPDGGLPDAAARDSATPGRDAGATGRDAGLIPDAATGTGTGADATIRRSTFIDDDGFCAQARGVPPLTPAALGVLVALAWATRRRRPR